jgi:hypothetical protein
VRILLLEMPQMLRDILEHAIHLRHDCEVVKDTSRGVRRQEPPVSPDVVILGLQADDDETLVPALFARWPATQVMTVLQGGDGAAVYEWQPRRRPLDHASPAELVDALRDAVHRRRDLSEE